MPEIRIDNVTGQKVLVAAGRGSRPKDFSRDEQVHPVKDGHQDDYSPTCPFCPGNEVMLPDILIQQENVRKKQWQTRVVPNKYSALSLSAENGVPEHHFFVREKAYGYHEVIIEHPVHNLDITDFFQDELTTVFTTYRERYLSIMASDDRICSVHVFRNYGYRAGSSLIHPHSQLMAVNHVPSQVRCRELQAKEYYDLTGRCLTCDLVVYETKSGNRIISENNAFLAYVPFAAFGPCHVRITPKAHQADIGALSAEDCIHLAAIVKMSLSALKSVLMQPAYNMAFNMMSRPALSAPFAHWYLDILPRLTIPAGFELSSGMVVNSSSPEEDADKLRAYV